MEKLKYYNRSLLANCEDNETISLSKAERKEAFKKYKKALFLIYTSNFDCGYDTGWYYVIRDSREDHLAKMNSHHRGNLQRISKVVECKFIKPSEYKDRIKEIGFSAIEGYKNYNDQQKFEYNDWRTIVGAFETGTNNLIGFSVLNIGLNQISIAGQKVDFNYRKLGVAYALNNFIVRKYLIDDWKDGRFVSNGQKTVIHETNHNNFLISKLGFRKAYCFLHIFYRPSIRLLMPVLRVFRPLLKGLDKIHSIHLVNSLLVMDKIARKQRKEYKDYV